MHSLPVVLACLSLAKNGQRGEFSNVKAEDRGDGERIFDPIKSLAHILFAQAAPGIRNPAVAGGLHRTRPAAIMETQVLERPCTVPDFFPVELFREAPPPSPPAPPDRGGGGGGDGEWPKSLRLLEPKEQKAIIGDWIDQTQVFRSLATQGFADTELAEEHAKAMDTLDALLSFTPSTHTGVNEEWIIAYVDQHGSVLALAGADVSTTSMRILDVENQLVVSRLAVKPTEVHDNKATIGKQMVVALRSLANFIKVRLQLTPLAVYDEMPPEEDQ
jgi:hypothetical protein